MESSGCGATFWAEASAGGPRHDSAAPKIIASRETPLIPAASVPQHLRSGAAI